MKKLKKERYYGIVKVPKTEKMSFLSKQDKHGWSLGLVIGERKIWMTGLRFADSKSVEKVLKNNIVFVHLKGK